MTVYKHDEKTCPACKRASLVRAGAELQCAEKRGGCGKTWAADTAAIVDQKPTTWRYRKQITLPDGRKVRIAGTPAINTQKAAEKAERDHVERELNPPKLVKARHKMRELFERLLTDYAVSSNNKPSEVESKRSAIDRYLEPELGALYVDEVTEERLSQLSAKISRSTKPNGEPLSAKTVKNVLQTLRRSLTWAAEDLHWLESAPRVRMPRVDTREMVVLTDVELAALLDAAASEPRWYAAIVLAADAGLRLGELRALRWSDINDVTKKVVVSRSRWEDDEGSTKSRKSRSVDMSQRLQAALRGISATSKLRGDYVLSKDQGGPYSTAGMTDTINRFMRKAKLDKSGWHVLRHTFCTRLAMNGVPISTIKELAGHSNITTTMRYMHVQPGSTARAIATLDEALPQAAPPPQQVRIEAGPAADAAVIGRALGSLTSAMPREWHGDDTARRDDSEVPALTLVMKATPTGFEPRHKKLG